MSAVSGGCVGAWALLPLWLALGACGERALDVLGPGDGADAGRDGGVTPGPLVRYRFDEGAGTRALDSSGGGALLHLDVEDPSRVTWLEGALRLDAPTALVSADPARALTEALVRSGALTVEAWVRPAVAAVEGTRRIVTLSESPTARSFTLGQGALFGEPPADAFVFRLRTTATSANGLPALDTGPGVAAPRLTHLVATRGGGVDALHVDGVELARRPSDGTLSPWDPSHRFGLGDELDSTPGDEARAWLGELHAVAIWDRALDPAEIAARLAAGPE